METRRLTRAARGGLWMVGGVVAALAGSAAAAAAAASCRAACPSTSGTVLSNETTFTTWATIRMVHGVRRSPALSSRRVGALHFETEDGYPEVYIVLRERLVGSGDLRRRLWAKVRLATRRRTRTGWVPRSALGKFHRVTTQLVVDRATDRLWLYRAGRLLLKIPVGVGRAATPTPAGHFWIREGFPVARAATAAYGPYALGTSAYSVLLHWPGGGVVGVHGTATPVTGPSSYGCITMDDANILRLSRLVPIGTPLLVK